MNAYTLTQNPAIQSLPVAVIGAGPVGLAALAQLLERGVDSVLLEASPRIAGNLREFGHVRLFSPWRYNIDKAARRAMEQSGWISPDPETLPSAAELVSQYLEPLAALPQFASRLRLGSKVVLIARQGFDKVKSKGRGDSPFMIRYETVDGRIHELKARAIIDASGTWSTPNPLGASGVPAIGEIEHREKIYYGIPDVLGADRDRYMYRRTLVVGAGHSAANSLLALAELSLHAAGTTLIWAVRGTDLRRVFGGGDADALPARGQLGSSLRVLRESGRMELATDFRLHKIESQGHSLVVTGHTSDGVERRLEGVDEIICATGQRPDYSPVRELRLKLDPWLESTEALGPLIDPNLHSCGTVRPHGHRELAHPEPGFYTAGVKSYGRAPTFLMATGYEQVRSIAAALAGDLAAADEVQLDLPETGVCSTTLAEPHADSGCCGTPAAQPSPTGGCGATGCSLPAQASRSEAEACCQ